MFSSPLVLKTIAALLSVAAGIASGYLISPIVGILVLSGCLWWFYKPATSPISGNLYPTNHHEKYFDLRGNCDLERRYLPFESDIFDR